MNGAPKNERFKPLPMRREFWKTLTPLIKDGVVLMPKTLPEREDARNAAQAILINYIEEDVLKTFPRPELTGDDLYEDFIKNYTKTATEQENRVWKNIGKEVAEKTEGEPTAPLDEKAAAFLTLNWMGLDIEPPRSEELYINVALYTRTYETLLKKKYSENYTPEKLYTGMRTHMPRFLTRFIAMDSVISALISQNSESQESRDARTEPGEAGPKTMYSEKTICEPGLMQLGQDDTLEFKESFVNLIHEHAKEKGFTEDHVGRTEDRGCPVLYSNQRDAVLKFAVEELIEQHKLFLERTQK